VLAGIVGVLLFFGLSYSGGSVGGGRSGANALATLEVEATIIAAQRTATVQPIASPTRAAAVLPQSSPTPQPTIAVATATTVAATATTAPPTATTAPAPQPTSPPAAPTAAPPPVVAGCVVDNATITNRTTGRETVTARLTCGGSPIAGAPMTALFYYQNTNSSCVGLSNSAGNAACTANPTTGGGALTSVSTCFSHQGQLYCGAASAAP
jgi:hypothetical protein